MQPEKQTKKLATAVKPVKAPAKRQGVGSRSGRANCHNARASDDKITELSQAQCDAAALKQIEVEADEHAHEQEDRDANSMEDGAGGESGGDDNVDREGSDDEELVGDEEEVDETAGARMD